MHLGDYDGNLGRRPYRPVRRRPPLPEDMPDEATAEVIRRKAEKYPKLTPGEVHFFLGHEDGRTDITMKQTRAVLYRK
jgi:hypothetical protein